MSQKKKKANTIGSTSQFSMQSEKEREQEIFPAEDKGKSAHQQSTYKLLRYSYRR